IHILADVSYDRVKTYKKKRMIIEDRMICEIQIRSKLQNAWSEFTHELHSKVPTEFQTDYDAAIADIANNLAVEDKSALVVREILQRLVESKEPGDFR
ncbi:MAG: GTP pyrophosphokinase, partial [Acidobacteriota bacterium]